LRSDIFNTFALDEAPRETGGGEMQYVLKAFEAEVAEPMLKTLTCGRDARALDLGRGLIRRRAGVRQVEVWCGERRVATVERVV
jgi:hypothetical protein